MRGFLTTWLFNPYTHIHIPSYAVNADCVSPVCLYRQQCLVNTFRNICACFKFQLQEQICLRLRLRRMPSRDVSFKAYYCSSFGVVLKYFKDPCRVSTHLKLRVNPGLRWRKFRSVLKWLLFALRLCTLLCLINFSIASLCSNLILNRMSSLIITKQ